MRRVIIGAILGLILAPVVAWGQTTYAQLPPGEQKIVNALVAAQTGAEPLGRDQIAAMKDKGGWGKVFRLMKEQGRLTQKNLGQVVSNFERQQHAARGAPSSRGRDEGAPGASEGGNSMGRGAGHSGG